LPQQTNAQADAPETAVTAIGPERLAAVAALDASAFGKLQVEEAIPPTWEERAKLAWEYYTEEPIVKNAVNAWRTFAIGDQITISCDDDDVKWKAQEFAERVALETFARDMILQLLVKGDCVGYKTYTDDGKDIAAVQCVNPVSVRLTYVQGQLTQARQYPEDAGAVGEGIELPLEQMIHLKWDAPSFSPRGNSIALPAFSSIALLRDYRKSEQAIAKRWTTPLRFVRVGGQFGSKLIMPDQGMLERIRDMINKMDLKAGLVAPFYCDVKTYGAEGDVLKTEAKVKEIKEDIIVALGMARSIVTGDGPNFATASVSMHKMIVMLGEIKQAARRMIRWVLDDWQEIKGYEEKTIEVLFNDLDLTDEIDVRKLLIELYDRRLISKKSLQVRMDLDPDVESEQSEKDRTRIDLTDEKRIKPVVDMVNAGIMSPEYAQELLGLPPEKNRPNTALQGTASQLFSQAGPAEAMCDDCAYFDEETNGCSIRETDTRFDNNACRYFEPRGDAPAETEARECAECR